MAQAGLKLEIAMSEDDLELNIFQSLPPKCLDCGWVPPRPAKIDVSSSLLS